jgi:hypothetical protein
VEEVLARLAKLESILEVQRIMFTYAECVDLARFEQLGELFTHGTIGAHGYDSPMRGHAQVRDFYGATNKVHGDGTLRTRHLSTNAIIDIDDGAQRASARSYFVVLQATESVPLQPIVAGRYHDTFHVIDGRWWFLDRLIFVDQIGNMSDHLSFDLTKDRAPRIGS